MKFKLLLFKSSAMVVLLAAAQSQALDSYVGLLGPFAGLGIDTNPSAAGTSYLIGDRFESVTIENHLSVLINTFLGLGIQFPSSGSLSINGSAASAYSYIGGVLRFEDELLRFGADKNATGLYYDLGLGAYYGRALNFSLNGHELTMTSSELSSARTQTQTLDGVVNVGAKLLLDFDQHFGIYPFFDYELVIFRNYFKTTFTDKKLKHRFFVGCGFAFEWWN